MILPSRLAATTLGDLLGSLYRARASGQLELIEVAAPAAIPGRRHSILLASGLVAGVESPLAGSPRGKLEAVFGLRDAAIRFHVGTRSGAATALAPAEFLHGRPRRRDLRACDAGDLAARRRAALATLGLRDGADPETIRRAFRRLAIALHPDRLAHLDEPERARRTALFARLAAAYHASAEPLAPSAQSDREADR